MGSMETNDGVQFLKTQRQREKEDANADVTCNSSLTM